MSARGVLLLAHGTPDSLDEMEEYLTLVRGGRPPTPELVEEMRRHYAAIGGTSPLTEITRAQASALQAELGGTPVFVGMRNWRPFIAEALREAEQSRVNELVVVPMAPQFSTVSVAKYRRAVEQGLPAGMRVRFVESWCEEPGLLDAFTERLREALTLGAVDAVVFTAHSLPQRVVDEGDPYPGQVRATAEGVAARARLSIHELAWQSAGRTDEPWLLPSLEQTLLALAGKGRRRVLVAPVGFVTDHTEILFDIDVQARQFAAERGIELRRTESLNTSPWLIGALAAIVRREWR